MFFQLPIEDAAEDGAFHETVDLDGSDYLFAFQYNSREGFWYFSISDANGTIIRSGVKIVANFPLLRLCVLLAAPPGVIWCANTEEGAEDPGLEDLGIDAVLSYIDEASVA